MILRIKKGIEVFMGIGLDLYDNEIIYFHF